MSKKIVPAKKSVAKKDPIPAPDLMDGMEAMGSEFDKQVEYMQQTLAILKSGNEKLREAANKLTTYTLPTIDKLV